MMGNCCGCRKRRPAPNSMKPHTSDAPSVSDPKLQYTIPEQGDENTPVSGDHDTPSSSCADHSDENETVITCIRATDVALGLRRIPAAFYVVVQYNGLEWRTENKRSSVNNNVVEWKGPIPIPSDRSAIVHLDIYVSFEFGPTLGNREQLRHLAITVEQLLDHTAKDLPFTFLPKDGDIVSPCSSLSVTVRRQKHETSAPSPSGILDPHCSITECGGRLKIATDEVQRALLHYRKHGGKRDTERSIEQFEQALNICPLDHPCRAATKSNRALGEVILYKVNNTGVPLDIPLALYCCALSARPVGHPDRPSILIHLAILHLARFEQREDEADAVQAEALLRQAMDLCSADSHEKWAASAMLQLHAERKKDSVQPGTQSKVEWGSGLGSIDEYRWTSGVKLLERYKRFGDVNDLQQSISLLEGLIKPSSLGDPWYPAALQNFGVALLDRFRRLGDLGDLERAISSHRDGVQLTPDGHPDKPSRLTSLGNSFLTRFEHLGEFGDLEQAISRQKDALHMTPDGHPDKPSQLNNVGNSFLTRFEHLGELGDLEQALLRLGDAVKLTADGHPLKPSRLNNLGNSFKARFNHLGELSDLEQAISSQRDAVQLTPDGHADKPAMLNNLGNSFLTRFDRLGELGDLERAISGLRDAFELTPDGHPDKPALLDSLGNAFLTRFECFGELGDLEQAVLRFRDAIELSPDGHPLKPSLLNSLGISFVARFKRLGELGDLDKAISMHGDALQLTRHGHPEKPSRLNNLGISFLARFERLGELSDLERAISSQTDAVEMAPDSYPGRAVLLSNLGNSLLTRFQRLGELGDLERAISSQRDAVQLTPDGHPGKSGRLINLGNSFLIRFERLGKFADLEKAILRFEDAVQPTPDGHPHKPGWLNNLGNSLRIRFEHLGELGDLERAILRIRDAVELTPDGHPDKPGWLSSLGTSLGTRFQRLGELGDLELAISMFRDVVQLTPDGHPDKPRWLSNLGNSLRTRFQRLGDLGDLEQAISRLKDAADLIPDGHHDKSGLVNNLGNSFLTRFERLGELVDLETAISTLSNAVQLTPDGHTQKPSQINNLGNSFRARFQRLGELVDLEKAILRFEDAVQLTPDGHPSKPGWLNNLGKSLTIRFEQLGELSDLERAISKQWDAVQLIPDDHPEKPDLLNNLGNSFFTRFEHLEEPSDLEQAILLYSYSASRATGPVTARFNASRLWISCSRILGHHTLLHAYSTAIALLPQLAWIGHSLSHRYHELVRGADVVRDAAAAAVELGYLETAVEWLEQGRSVVWGELSQLRSSYDELFAVYPDHARKLRQLSIQLEQATTTREESHLDVIQDEKQGATESSERVANRHRKLAIERDKLLQEIRGLPGFERFLLHKEFSQLRASAHSGPIVILNTAEGRCDALIVLADVDNVVHVPFPNFPLTQSEALQTLMKGLVRDAGAITVVEREGKRLHQELGSRWESVLTSLWHCVVGPVLNSLAFVAPRKPSRIFWCPTGPLTFLPIHAAGLYDTEHSQPGHKAFDFVVSSYIPTLSILALEPEPEPHAASSGDIHFLAVRQPPSDGLSHLPGVDAELKHIRKIIGDSPSASITLQESSDGSVEEVLGLMKDADWVHFACHGIQDAANPTESGLCLANERRLKLTNIIALSRPRGGLAFLSACQTATGDKTLSDEAIHIAAGMLFAGYGGVVGTMWSIRDSLAPVVAKDVYKQLFSNGTKPDHREAARALQEAVGRLRESGASFSEWIPFIHVGL